MEQKRLGFVRQVLAGKTLARVLFNRAVARHAHALSGAVLDLAGGEASYAALLPKGVTVTGTDVRTRRVNDLPVDFNEPLPFEDGSFDHVLLFNALYIAQNPEALLREIRRVLRTGGTALVASPFMQSEMREPHDYRRLTSEGLEQVFRNAGFVATMEPYGERFSVAANLLHPFWYFSLLRLPVYLAAVALDRLIPNRVRTNHPAPLGYFCVLTTSHDAS